MLKRIFLIILSFILSFIFAITSIRDASAYVPVIDPGHGGEDGGAVSPGGDVESEINLDISMKMKYLFCLFGISPVMIRETDISIHNPKANSLRETKVSDLKNRVSLINSVEEAFLISIHQNTFTDSRYSGAHIFYNGEQSRDFAVLLQKRIRDHIDPSNTREAKKVPKGVYLMEHVKCPAILAECGFMTNLRELELLRNPSYRVKLALLIVSTYLILEY